MTSVLGSLRGEVRAWLAATIRAAAAPMMPECYAKWARCAALATTGTRLLSVPCWPPTRNETDGGGVAMKTHTPRHACLIKLARVRVVVE